MHYEDFVSVKYELKSCNMDTKLEVKPSNQTLSHPEKGCDITAHFMLGRVEAHVPSSVLGNIHALVNMQAKHWYVCSDTISYPLFVHAIRENINGLGSYHTRLKAECDTNPNH